jgi:hypothetical protein
VHEIRAEAVEEVVRKQPLRDGEGPEACGAEMGVEADTHEQREGTVRAGSARRRVASRRARAASRSHVAEEHNGHGGAGGHEHAGDGPCREVAA